MKKVLSLLLSGAMVLSLAACAGGGSGGTAESKAPEGGGSGEKVVKIGIFEPASGDNGAGGKQEALGIKYAHSVQPTVEIGGETYTVELVPADNQSANDKAPSAAQTLISAGVSVVLGSWLRRVHRRQ